MMTEVLCDLDSDDAETRRRATSEIAGVGATARPELLIRALGDADWRVRKEATQVALAIGPDAAIIAALVGVLRAGDNVGLRNAVVETLASMGSAAVPAVTDEIAGLSADGRKLAAEILGRAQDVGAMPALERLAGDADANVRNAAVDAIGDLGGVAIEASSRALLRLLGSGDRHVVLAALEGMNRLGIIAPWESLRRLATDPILRRPVLVACARSGSIEAASFLAAALEDDQEGIVRVAMSGLAELHMSGTVDRPALARTIGTVGPRARERLVRALAPEAGDVFGRRVALVVAAIAGEPVAIDAAIEALVDDETACEAAAAIEILGVKALPRILARVAEGDAALRVATIERLAAIGGEEPRSAVRLALRAATNDSDEAVASAALSAIGSMGSFDDIAAVIDLVSSRCGAASAAMAALAALAKRWPDQASVAALACRRDERAALPVAIVIGAIGGGVIGDAADDVTFLSAALSSADPETRKAAADALGRVGSDLALSCLELAIADESRDVQLSAVRALGRLRTEGGRAAGLDRLLDLARGTDPDIIAAAARAIGEAGDVGAVEQLSVLVRSTAPFVAVAAVEALGKLSNRDAVGALVGIGDDAHAEVVKATLIALGGVSDRRAFAWIGRALDHGEWDVRRVAADCIGRFGGQPATDLLRARLAVEKEPLVIEAIVRAIAVIEAPPSVRCLPSIPPGRADP
jgi:HEAT repeat protein